MKIVRGYKEGRIGENNKRKFAVPENGSEANNFRDYGHGVSEASKEVWQCHYVDSDGKRNPGKTTVFRFRANAGDARITYIVNRGLEYGLSHSLKSLSVDVVDREARIEYPEGFLDNKW